ncbi:MAG: hypothetical protein A2669_01935 [Candidatus Yanofskybacteria bacterium RIFCSPHIGHO2_01_FULL_48_25b]|uniref:Uncharacterized protein n=1 Tax=Candidatus Yanofskybacteria bacterium RIFCSPHIGHO2_01_FULL_48_25b TaxID=1802672 RepID=A0A1F8F2V6_9BACT|nr:MAG: hypothetical protein A2669_01935 [Candidatus Yanofskybacteria bacterium RIFCSPHIGHO2_01_FULL_48_25b]
MTIAELIITIKVNLVADVKKPDLKANVTLNFSDKFRVSGISIRKSQYDSEFNFEGVPLFVGYPGNKKPNNSVFYFFSIISPEFKKELEKAIMDEYLSATIPIIN